MGNNRNPPDESAEQPGSPELDERNRRAQEQDSQIGGRRPDNENTTTDPWIRNKTS